MVLLLYNHHRPVQLNICRPLPCVDSSPTSHLSWLSLAPAALPAQGVGVGRIKARETMVMLGQLGRFVDGIKSKLRAGGKRGPAPGKKAAAAAAYDKMDKTDSMRVEIKSRRTQKLIAKNLGAADSMGRRNKRFFRAF